MAYSILLIDDDDDFRQEMKDCLYEYAVTEAKNGKEAVSILKNPHTIDLIVLDVRLPDKNGTGLLRELKEMVPEMPIIILTGYSSKDTAVDALRGNADDYLEKPVSPAVLLETIDGLLKKKEHLPDLNGAGTEGVINHVKYYVEKNFDKKVNLSTVAKRVCLSPKYLSRLFKQETGKGFSEYKLEIKTNKAKELLCNTAYTVEFLADKLGYQNTESFIRIFKKYTRLTPTAYREYARGNNEHATV